jgi:hypothetical protein
MAEATAASPAEAVPTEYPYRAPDGTLLYAVERRVPKGFLQRRPDPDRPGGWLYNLDGVGRILYKLPELRTANLDEPVFIVEGEKDVDRLIADGLVATCNPMGAGKWRDDYSRELADRDVIVIPDNDEAGRAHAEDVARSVAPHAHSVKVLKLPGLPAKGDASDYFDAGGTAEGLLRLAGDAPLYSPPASVPEKRPVPRVPAATRPRPTGHRKHYDKIEVLEAMAPEGFLEIASELRLRIVDAPPDHDGWVACRAIDREDNHPSASFNVYSGYHIDHGRGDEKLSIFDLAMALDEETYPDLCTTIDKLGERFLGDPDEDDAESPPEDAEEPPVDIEDVRRRVHAVVESKDQAKLYRDGTLLADLARLERTLPDAFAEMKVSLSDLKNFRARDFAAALAQHRPAGVVIGNEDGKGSDAAILIDLGQKDAELFHDPGGKPFARLLVDGHHENHAVRGPRFRQIIKCRFYEAVGYTPNAETFRSALDVLELKALEGPVRTVHVRTAEVIDPADPEHPTYYLDLGDVTGRAVKITSAGWDIIEDPPVRFRRPYGMLPLPDPERGGSLNEIWRFVNIRDQHDRMLFKAWLRACVRPLGRTAP